MSKYKLKLNKWLFILSFPAIALCLFIIVTGIINAFSAPLAVDAFTSVFLALVNLIILVTITTLLLSSGYSFGRECITMRTSFFTDRLYYSDISKILLFMTEDELYILNKDGSHKKINISPDLYSRFVNDLKQKLPEIPYEISFNIEETD